MRLFLICYYGNEIEFNSRSFLQETFHEKFFDVDKNRRKDLVILQENLKNHDVVKVFNFVNVNMEIFLRVVKAAYSMLAVLGKIKK